MTSPDAQSLLTRHALPADSAAAVRGPRVLLLLLLLLACILPLEVQRRGEVAALLPSDLLLAALLLWAALDLPWRPMDRRTSWVVGGLVLFLVVVVLQQVRALAAGQSLSGSGAETRALLGVGTLLVTLPLLADPTRRAALARGLTALALALGLWGVAQPLFGLAFDVPDEMVSSTSASYLTAGRTVGMFVFPVAALVASAALALGAARTRRDRLVLVAVVGLNVAAVLLTFGRTFIGVLLLGFLLLVVGLPGRVHRLRLALQAGTALVAVVLVLLVTDPGRAMALQDRLGTLRSPERDVSVQYRVAEERLVRRHIDQQPWLGEGPGAAMRIGRPGTERAVVDRRYAENGYLWLTWKMGLPAAVLLCAVLLAAVTAPGRLRMLPDLTGQALAVGARASLVALAVASYFFGSFSQIAVTPVIGLLAACCLTPVVRSTR